MYESELQNEGFDVIGISQFNTTPEDTQRFIDDNGLTFANIYDGISTLANAYNVQGVPSYVFIDQAGRVVETSSGARGTAYLADTLRRIKSEDTGPAE